MSQVAIRPFLNEELDNHGLTKEGLVVADNCTHAQALACLDNNGVKTYITGLNEGAKSVSILDAEKKNAKILDIRKTVIMAENQIAGNYSISEADIYTDSNKDKFNPLFWNKVTKFKSVIADEFDAQGNRKPTFWDTVELKVGNIPEILDESRPMDIILIKAIEAGGFGDIVVPSLERAKELPGNSGPKFYLDRLEDTATLTVEVKKLRNKAGAILETLFSKDTDKLFYILKNLGIFSLGYRKSTPHNVLYDDLDKHLDGLGAEKNKRIAIENFLELADPKKVSGEELRIRAIAKDASALNIIAPKGDGGIYYIKTGIPVGKSPEDVVMWLKNPMNSKELMDITTIVEKEWNTK